VRYEKDLIKQMTDSFPTHKKLGAEVGLR